jgi:cytidine deaminase
MTMPMNDRTQELTEAAAQARARAYAPYSGFQVGAAVLTRDGRIFTGANVENASYGLTLCAERNAIMQAVLAGAKDIVAVAVSSGISPPATPCGMCRQTMAEFAEDCEIILSGGPDGSADRRTVTLAQLLPQAFRPAALLRGG